MVYLYLGWAAAEAEFEFCPFQQAHHHNNLQTARPRVHDAKQTIQEQISAFAYCLQTFNEHDTVLCHLVKLITSTQLYM